MTLVENLRLFQDRKHFETMVNEEYEKTKIKNILSIFIIIAFIFINLSSFSSPLSSFYIVCFSYSFWGVLGWIIVLDDYLYDYHHNKISLIVEEKKYGYLVLNCHCIIHSPTTRNVIFLAWLILFSFIFIAYFLLKYMDWHFMIYVILFIHSCYLLIPLLFLLLSLFVFQSIRHDFIDKEMNELIEKKQIKIYNEHFNDFDLEYNNNDKIKFINQVVEKLSDESNNENLLKELNLLDNFKKSNLKFDLNEVPELNNIVLSVSSSHEFNSKKESVLNSLIRQKNNINKKFDDLLEEYQSFIDVNQKYLHEGESNTLSFKIKFDKLIETEKSIFEKLENPVELPDDSEIWLIQIENEINLLNAEKKNIIQELKLKKQQSEQYVKDILIKEVS